MSQFKVGDKVKNRVAYPSTRIAIVTKITETEIHLKDIVKGVGYDDYVYALHKDTRVLTKWSKLQEAMK